MDQTGVIIIPGTDSTHEEKRHAAFSGCSSRKNDNPIPQNLKSDRKPNPWDLISYLPTVSPNLLCISVP